MKKSVVAVSALLLALSLSACTKKQAETKLATRTIVDHNGHEVVLPVDIERVVIISPMPLPSIYCLFMGGTDKLVGMHPSSMAAAKNSYLKKVYPDVVNIETGFIKNGTVNIEELLKLNPDVVFYLASDKNLEQNLKNAGLAAVAFSTSMTGSNTIENYALWIEKFGEIFGDTGRADAIINYGREVEKRVAEKIATIQAAARPKAMVLYNYDASGIKVSGGNFYGEYWLNSAGAVNVATELNGMAATTIEQIYQWNPDYIFITNFTPCQPEDLYTNAIEGADWSEIAAVKNKHVYKYPLGMYRWFPPSPDAPLALQWIAQTVHPELFEELDIRKEVSDYFARFYGVSLTEEDIDAIFHPAREAGTY